MERALASSRDEMQRRLDPLIEERAPWLFSGRLHHRIARRLLMQMLGYPRTLDLGAEFSDKSTAEIFQRMEEMIIRDLEVAGLEHIPRDGPALIVANHPTGIADGIVMFSLIRRVRPDLFIYTNQDILRVLPQLDDMIVPVEWRIEKRSHAKTRATMEQTRAWLAEDRIGLIFPSGRLAKRKRLTLHERPWMASAAMIARKMGVPVIPLRIRARNSILFYLFDAIHPTLRDVTLFHEVLNKAGQQYQVTIGAPVAAKSLPSKSDEAIEMLRRIVLSLPEPDDTIPVSTSRLVKRRIIRHI
ncbi:1-acyl-sn-glycerol-3-phosphate acyltransferase [Paracoccus aerodenitrificans]|uniref:1-acyl-sn-glycerol-3-phosphate acyltransferase n=1 Tax=Paracoccus aerodenitrificans TaxID=3017781 RepID=UPI0022F0599A|nr:1-acyl-sn-glycerol-3-phosphate acyltransferase [Paracoccus aerodenitrificans]WBU65505.1 1-acyl-sn-glycerol-3-phosphate acyltransferase [Paracoccus aerodenitrificans]